MEIISGCHINLTYRWEKRAIRRLLKWPTELGSRSKAKSKIKKEKRKKNTDVEG